MQLLLNVAINNILNVAINNTLNVAINNILNVAINNILNVGYEQNVPVASFSTSCVVHVEVYEV